MASLNKVKKLSNSHFERNWLKNKDVKMKYRGFYNSAVRAENKRVVVELLKEYYYGML